jgi:hypothetical protein
MRTPALYATTLVLFGAIAATACGSSADDSGFGSSGGSSGSSGGASSGASGSGGFGGTSSGASGSSGQQQQKDECKKMDIVFVVDNSGSMREEQTNLATNFPKFVNVINAYKTKSGAELDYRVAVTTSDDKAEKGRFTVGRGKDAPASCVPGPARPWLERVDGNVASMFACRAQAGTSGSNIERDIESAFLSVTDRIADGSNTANGQPFVREDALLAMVLITDEDEGGTENQPKRPVSQYPALFDGVKKERGRWAAAVIAGETQCTSPGLGNAAEAKRMKEFITAVGKNGVFASICTGDLTDGLTKALATFDQACKDFPSGPVK